MKNVDKIHFANQKACFFNLSTLFMLCSVTCLIMRPMVGYTNGQQFDHNCNLVTLNISTLTNILILVCSKYYKIYL